MSGSREAIRPEKPKVTYMWSGEAILRGFGNPLPLPSLSEAAKAEGLRRGDAVVCSDGTGDGIEQRLEVAIEETGTTAGKHFPDRAAGTIVRWLVSIGRPDLLPTEATLRVGEQEHDVIGTILDAFAAYQLIESARQ